MISADKLTVKWDKAALARMLRGPHGEVAKDIERRCIRIQAAATDLCPVDTGRLRASVSYDVGADNRGVVGYVGSNVEYAPHVELGTARTAARPFLRPAIDAGRG